ncbi:MAG: hypothetical protein ACI39E_00645 [Acutalibacteraceae bacterium]
MLTVIHTPKRLTPIREHAYIAVQQTVNRKCICIILSVAEKVSIAPFAEDIFPPLTMFIFMEDALPAVQQSPDSVSR